MYLRAEPHNNSLQKAVRIAGRNLRKVRKAAVLSFFWNFVRQLETCTREGDQIGFYKHLKMMNLEGKRNRNSAYVKDENVVLLRDNSSANDGGSTLSPTPSHREWTRTSQKALTSGTKTCR